MSQPIIKVRNGSLEIAIFEATTEGQYGARTEYQFSLTRSIKNKQTGDWDRIRVPLYENQVLELAELLSVAHRQLVAYKNKPSADAAPATEPDAEPVAASVVDDDIPF